MTNATKPPIWILIDATNIVHRDAHGVGITNAAENLGRRIEAINQKFDPAAIVAAFDPPGKSWRHSLHKGYKAGRVRMLGIDDALDVAKDVCSRCNVRPFVIDGFEADDVIATLTDAVVSMGNRVIVYSADKDLHQLIREGEVLQLLNMKRKLGKIECEWFNAADMMEKHLVTPEQWVEWKMLVGDPSDKIDGVPGIGDKTASNILASCGTLEEFYKRPFAAPISPKQRTAVMNARPKMELTKQLCTLRRDVPLPEMWMEAV